MYLHFTNLAVKMKLSFAANLLLLSSLSVLLSIAIADPLVVGTEPLNASELTIACVSEHGLLYRVGRGSQGYIAVAGQDDEGQAGVMVVQSAIGKHAIHCPSMVTQPLATQAGDARPKRFKPATCPKTAALSSSAATTAKAASSAAKHANLLSFSGAFEPE